MNQIHYKDISFIYLSASSSLISTDGPICPGDTQSWTYNADGNFKDGRDYIHFSCRE